MAQSGLGNAKKAKADEFYTQYEDIQKEMNSYIEYNKEVFKDKTILLPCDDPEWSNFTKFFATKFEEFGLKKLISTSFAPESKNLNLENYQPSLFEFEDEKFDKDKTKTKGKIFTLTKEDLQKEKINTECLKWKYLEGTGDFRSEEVKKLRDEADIIITNPPFSLFREFIAWIMDSKKQFAVIGNINCITYKEIFPLLKENKVWLGNGMGRWISGFIVPKEYELYGTEARIDEKGNRIVATNNCLWLTNIEHGKRHQPLSLMTMADNTKFSKHKEIKGIGYKKYDNYDAIEVPYTDAIPSDYEGVMGVPISFLDKYCPEQFEILGASQRGCHDLVPDTKKYDDYWEVKQNGEKTGSSGNKTNENTNLAINDGKKNYFINSEGHIVQSTYQRIFIRKIKEDENADNTQN